MIAVTDLTGYLYCPRKLYFRKVLKIKEAPKALGIRGSIKHAVFDESGREDRQIATSFTKLDSLSDLEMKYRRIYYQVLMRNIQARRKQIKEVGEDPLIMYRELWPFFLQEAKQKSAFFYNLAKEKNIYGEALWFALPKSVPELRIKSKKLGMIGIVDKVDIDRGFIPIEIKTGKAPTEGVWKNNLIQVGAYMLLLSEHYGKEINEGYVEYRAIGQQRRVVMNPFLKDEILELRDEVEDMLKREELPPIIEDNRKCDVCGIKDQCYSKAKDL